MIIYTDNLILREPSLEDIPLIKRIWLDEETMKSVGGIVSYSDKEMLEWHRSMFEIHKTKNHYFLIFDKSENLTGEVSCHNFKEGIGMLNIKILADRRGRGFGDESLSGFLKYYFEILEAERIIDDIWIKNPAGYKFLIDYGFSVLKSKKESVEIFLDRDSFLEKKMHYSFVFEK